MKTLFIFCRSINSSKIYVSQRMDECIEISSDSSTSNETLNYEVSEELHDFLNKTCDKDEKESKDMDRIEYDLDLSSDEFIFEPLDVRLNKNKTDNKTSQEVTSSAQGTSSISKIPKSLYQFDSSSEEDMSNKYNFEECFKACSDDKDVVVEHESNSRSQSSDEEETDLSKSKKRQKKTSVDKDQRTFEKEQKKKEKAEERARERELKKQQKENEKAMKNALKVVENCIKPDQCAQYITVNLDEDLLNIKTFGKVIIAGLEDGGYQHKVVKQKIPNGITWIRKVPTLENMLLKNVFQEEKYFLSILEVSEFIPMIANKMFTGYVQSILSLPNIKHATVAILNVQKYYKYLENERNKEFKAAVLEKDKKPTKSKSGFENLPVVKKYELDLALTELQILCKNCYVRFVDSFEDLAVFVGECSKAVAQAPYKAEKAEKTHKSEEFFQGHNKDCVRVDKDGNGLSRLWSQILKSFPLASLETSEAILNVYPTLKALITAYGQCDSEQEKQCLLQDIQVRRAAGPLTTSRRIGRELSRKYYLFFAQSENLLI